MKKYRIYGGLFATPLLITARCNYLTNTIINNTNYTPPLEQANHAQAELLTIHSIPNEKYKTKISGLSGLLRLWNTHRPDRKSIQLEY
jgi:hypothetical protein